MIKLFNENLGLAANRNQLDTLKKKFNHYDPIYVAVSTMNNRPKFRDWLKNLWKQYQPYADTNFLVEFKKRFNQRAWELYLGTTLLNRGYTLGKHNDEGPDFKIPKDDTTNWIEAISIGKGVEKDRVPEIEYGKAVEVPEKEMLLRLTAGLAEKYSKYLSYSSSGFIGSDDPFVITIDRSGLEYSDPQIPLILKCLFSIGHQVLFIKDRKTMPQTEGSTWSLRDKISKISGTEIPLLLFRDSSFEGINAVIYCSIDILNCPQEPENMGNNFVIIHNPFAKNPLPENYFKFGEKWKQEGNQIKKTRENNG